MVSTPASQVPGAVRVGAAERPQRRDAEAVQQLGGEEPAAVVER